MIFLSLHPLSVWNPFSSLKKIFFWLHGVLVVAGRFFRCGEGLVAQDMWDLSSLTRDGTHILCLERQILNHWTTGEVPILFWNFPYVWHPPPDYFVYPLFLDIGMPQSYALHSLSVNSLAFPWPSHPYQAESNIFNCHMNVFLYIIFNILKWNIIFSFETWASEFCHHYSKYVDKHMNGFPNLSSLCRSSTVIKSHYLPRILQKHPIYTHHPALRPFMSKSHISSLSFWNNLILQQNCNSFCYPNRFFSFSFRIFFQFRPFLYLRPWL